ncbi:MAG: hypothetical protein ACFFC9_06410 [Promethearchaeota archaeon]
MKEIGIDILNHRSKHIKEFYGAKIDLAITVCDNAQKICHIFSGAKINVHKSFLDPSAAIGTEKQKLDVFRKVRDQIKKMDRRRFNELNLNIAFLLDKLFFYIITYTIFYI